MPRKYTAGELRAWHRGYKKRLLEKPCVCHSNNPNYSAAFRDGWFASDNKLFSPCQHAQAPSHAPRLRARRNV
jgi:hypothetical protein